MRQRPDRSNQVALTENEDAFPTFLERRPQEWQTRIGSAQRSSAHADLTHQMATRSEMRAGTIDDAPDHVQPIIPAGQAEPLYDFIGVSFLPIDGRDCHLRFAHA